MLPMFGVTAVAGAALWVAIGKLPVRASEQGQLRGGLTGILLIALLLVLIVGMIRR
jgi:hypothetical protein